METLVRYGQTVSKMYEAFNKGDIPFILAQLHRDVIWESMGAPDIPYAGIYHGPQDVKLFFQKMNDQVEWREFVAEHILENNNLVISTGYGKGAARKTKKLISSIWAMSSEFNEDGKIVHFRDCFDTMNVAKALTK
jgi:ketosteroid isomerase-like protein